MYPVLILIPLFLIALLLNWLLEWHEGIYNDILLISVISLIVYAIGVPIQKRKNRNSYKAMIKEDAQRLTHAIHLLEEFNLSATLTETVSDAPILLSLDEQYQYIQDFESENSYDISDRLKEKYNVSYMSLTQMEHVFQDNLQSLQNQLKEKTNWYQFLKEQEHQHKIKNPYEWMRLKVFDDEYGRSFAKQFNLSIGDVRDFQSKCQELIQKYDDWNREKKQFTWTIKQGVDGEQKIVDGMKLMLSEGKVLENVRVEYMDRSAESDVIYVGTTGVFTLEVKNFGSKGNWNIHISKDGQWQRVYPNGNREPMNDVGSQINYHVAVQEKLINDKLKVIYGDSAPKIKMKGAAVIANDTVMVENLSDITVLRESSIYRFLEQGDANLGKELQERIIQILEEYKLPGRRFKVPNFYGMMENILLELNHLSELYQLRYKWLEELEKESVSDSPTLKEEGAGVRYEETA